MVDFFFLFLSNLWKFDIWVSLANRLKWNNTSKLLLLVCETCVQNILVWLSQTLLLADLQYWVIWTDLGEPVRLDINIKRTVMRRTPASTQAKNKKTSTGTLLPGQIVSRMWWFLTSVSSGFWFPQFYFRHHVAKILDLFAPQREYDNKSFGQLWYPMNV